MSESSRLLSPATKQALPVRAGSSESFDEDSSSSTIPSSSKGKTSLVLTAMTFANGVVGAGIIGLPGALNQAGFTAGIILCVLVAVLSAWTLRVLADTARFWPLWLLFCYCIPSSFCVWRYVHLSRYFCRHGPKCSLNGNELEANSTNIGEQTNYSPYWISKHFDSSLTFAAIWTPSEC
jgi:hypothetical protein